MNNSIESIINNKNYWNEIISLLEILDHLNYGITSFESDESKLSQFWEWFYNLFNLKCMYNIYGFFNYFFKKLNLFYLGICNSYEISTIFKNRWKKLYHPVMEVAYFLDSRFIG